MRLIVVGFLLPLANLALAQSTEPISDAYLSKEAMNPVTRHVTVPLRYEAEFRDGVDKVTKSTFELDQAILPFRLNNEWTLITRTKLPVIDQPPKKKGDHWTWGFSNGYTTFFLSPEYGRLLNWGAGPVLYYPSATNTTLGVHRWGTGPSVALVKRDESPWVVGMLVNNIWSLGGGTGDSDRTNSFLLNPFISYHFDDGWSVGSSPNIKANWIAKGGKWTVPIGGGGAKLIRLGDQSIKLAVDAYYQAIRPKAGNDTWVLQGTMTILFPK